MVSKDELLLLLLEQINVGVIVVDSEDDIVFANPAAESIRGISAKEILGRSVLHCHAESSRERVKRALGFLRQEHGKPFTRMVTEESANRAWENTYTPLREADGSYAGAAVISLDISKRRKQEAQRALDIEGLHRQIGEMTRSFHELLLASMSSLVAALEAKDKYTAGHSVRVAAIAKRVAEHRWGLSPASREVEMAGLVHDIGKVGIREGVLGKPGPLSDEELRHIREHPILSEQILLPVDQFGAVAKLARHHHERFNGEGYPDGLKGESIPDGCRILAIADAYDAMTTGRPYRKAMAPEEAAAEIERQMGTQFDPGWGSLFLELFYSGSVG